MKFLIAGSTGRVGRPLVEELHRAGHHVRALTRSGSKAQFPEGVEVIIGDLTKPETFAAALEGVTGLHLINVGGDDYAPLQTGAEIIALAEQAGVKRVTVLLGGGEMPMEAAVKASSLEWTFLQPVEFMSGISEYAESIRSEGVVRQPFADRKTAIVHDADIASVAASVLVNGGYNGQTLPITGSEVLTPRQMVQIIGEAIGQSVQFIELTEAEAREMWASQGMPQEFIEFAVWVYGNTPPVGYTVTPIVEQVTGRPARTFAQWAAENADAFRV